MTPPARAVAARAFPARPDQVFGGYAFDLDGTVYLGDEALPGAVGGIRRLREAGRAVVFVTNKPLATADYAAKLTRLGIPSAPSDVVTAVDALLLYLQRSHPGAVILAVAEPPVHDALRAGGSR